MATVARRAGISALIVLALLVVTVLMGSATSAQSGYDVGSEVSIPTVHLAKSYPGGLNKTEAHWCAVPSHVSLCDSAYLDLARWAKKHAKNCEKDTSICTNGDEANAYQHCLWSATLKLYHGESTARGFLTRHEANSNGDADSQRDWKNNAVGFQVATDAATDMYINQKLTRKGAIQSRCVDLARNEQLTYIT